MYVIKLFAKQWNRTGYSDVSKKNIQPGYWVEYGREKCAMLIIKRGKRQIRERIELPKFRKNQNTWRKGKLLVLRNNGKRKPSDKPRWK